MSHSSRLVPLLAALPLYAFGYPRNVTWRGTLISTSGAGTFTAHTHAHDGRDEGLEYDGAFRCHGPGCLARHGKVQFIPLDAPTAINEVFLTYRHGRRRYYCDYVNDGAPADRGVNGGFTCFLIFPPQDPQPIVATGTLVLSGLPK